MTHNHYVDAGAVATLAVFLLSKQLLEGDVVRFNVRTIATPVLLTGIDLHRRVSGQAPHSCCRKGCANVVAAVQHDIAPVNG